MHLVDVKESHFSDLVTWFSDEHSLAEWSGPNFRYPFDENTFKEDLKLDSLRSFSLVSEREELLAFGQFYDRLNRCHLGRLVVNPKFRGQGIASELMLQLCEVGLKSLELTECSLFVLAQNEKAIRAYKKFGFSFEDYPEEIPLENCLYMVKKKS